MKLENVSKSFEQNSLFSSLSLSFSSGLLELKGKSGCGKTTLRKIRLGKEKPDSGTVTPFSSFSYCGSEDSLFSPFSLKDNLSIFNKDYDKELRKELLDDFSFSELMDTPIGSLSQGERKKAEIIACFLKDAECYFLDEPFSSLDQEAKDRLKTWIERVAEKKAVVLINHDTEEEINPDRLIEFSNHQASVVFDRSSASNHFKPKKEKKHLPFKTILRHLLRKNKALFISKACLVFLSFFFFSLSAAFTDTNTQLDKYKISRENNPYSSFRFYMDSGENYSDKLDESLKGKNSYHQIRIGKTDTTGQEYLFFSTSSVPENKLLYFVPMDNTDSLFNTCDSIEFMQSSVSFDCLTEQDAVYYEMKNIEMTGSVLEGGDDKTIRTTSLIALSLKRFDSVLSYGLERMCFVSKGQYSYFRPLVSFSGSASLSDGELSIAEGSSSKKAVIDSHNPYALIRPGLKGNRAVRISGYGQTETTADGEEAENLVIGKILYLDILLHQYPMFYEGCYFFVLDEKDYSSMGNSKLCPIDVINDYTDNRSLVRYIFYAFFALCFIGYILLSVFSFRKEKEYIKERNDVLFYQGYPKEGTDILQSLLPLSFCVLRIGFYFACLPLANYCSFHKRFPSFSFFADLFGSNYASFYHPIPFFSPSWLLVFILIPLTVFFFMTYCSLKKK